MPWYTEPLTTSVVMPMTVTTNEPAQSSPTLRISWTVSATRR